MIAKHVFLANLNYSQKVVPWNGAGPLYQVFFFSRWINFWLQIRCLLFFPESDMYTLWDHKIPHKLLSNYCETSTISHTRPQHINVSRLLLQLSVPNPVKPSVKPRMKMWLEHRRQAMLQLHLMISNFIATSGAAYIRCLIIYIPTHLQMGFWIHEEHVAYMWQNLPVNLDDQSRPIFHDIAKDALQRNWVQQYYNVL